MRTHRIALAGGLVLASLVWFVVCLVAGLAHQSDWFLGGIPFGLAGMFVAGAELARGFVQ